MPARLSETVGSILPSFSGLQVYITYALLAYAIALALLAIRHQNGSLLILGVSTISLATAILHLISWTGYICFVIGAFIFSILSSISDYFERQSAPVRNGLQEASGVLWDRSLSVFEPVLGEWAWVGLLATSVLALLTVLWIVAKGPRLVSTVLKVTFFIVGAIVFFGLLGLLLAFLWRHIGPVFPYVVGTLGSVLALLTIGQLFIDQIRSSTLAGSGRLGVLMGAIAIGSTLSILLLVGNVYGVYELYPDFVARFAADYLNQAAPSFDAFVTLCIISLCFLGVIRSLPQMLPEPDLAEFGKSLIYTVVGVVVAGALAALGRQTER